MGEACSTHGDEYLQCFGKNRLEDLGIGRMIILELILGQWNGKLWTGFFWFRIGTSVGLL